jgi:predicted site-specific integrase-resolvase
MKLFRYRKRDEALQARIASKQQPNALASQVMRVFSPPEETKFNP